MAEKSRFFDSTAGDVREYSADEFAEVFRTFFKSGIIKNETSNESAENALKVTKGSTTGTMAVAPGYAIIDGYWYHNDSSLTVNIPVSPSLPRKDLIVLRRDSQNKKIAVTYLTGSASVEPTPFGNDIPLAYVFVAPGGNQAIEYADRRQKFCQALYTLNLSEFVTEFTKTLENFKADARTALGNFGSDEAAHLTDHLEDEPLASRIFQIMLDKDGADSGLNADLLDGKQGAYYQDYNNLINKPSALQQIFSGTTEPAAALGNDGDIYVKVEG